MAWLLNKLRYEKLTRLVDGENIIIYFTKLRDKNIFTINTKRTKLGIEFPSNNDSDMVVLE